MAKQIGEIVIEKLFGGWADDLTDNSQRDNHAVEGQPGQYSQSQALMINRPGFEGHLAPGFTFTSLTDTGTIVNGLPLNATITVDDVAWSVLDNGRLVWWDLSDVLTPNTIQNITQSATLNSTKNITSTATGLTRGMNVTGQGMPFGTYISSISGNVESLNNAATLSATENVTFTAYHDIVQTVQAGTLTSVSSLVTGLPETGSLSVGMPVTGTGLPAGTKVYAISSDTNIILTNTASIDGASTLTFGTASVASGFNDITFYPSQSGAPPTNTTDNFVFWSWENTTQGDVAMHRITDITGLGRTFTDTYLTGLANQQNGTALIKGVPHPLIIGQDNNLYIGNGRYLAQHDPTTTTVNYEALDLKPGWVINGLAIHQNFIAVLAYRKIPSTVGFYPKSESKVFLWDGFSPSWNQEYDLRDYYATNILQDGTDLYVLTQGRSGTSKLKYFAGYGFQTIYETQLAGAVPDGVISNTPCIGAIDLYLNHIAWPAGQLSGIGASFLNLYGSPTERQPKGFHSFSFNTTANGMCKNLLGNTLYIGNKDSNGNYHIQYSFPNFNKNTTFRSLFYPMPTNSTITAVKTYFSQFGSGASVKLSLMKDYDSVTFGGAADLLNTTIDNATYGAITYFPISKTIDNVNGFYLAVQWNHASETDTAAIIRKIEIEYLWEDGNI